MSNEEIFLQSCTDSMEMRKNVKKGYEECFLGIVDILGFSNFVKNNKNAPEIIVSIIDRALFNNKNLLDGIEYKILSDTFIVYTKKCTQLYLLNLIFALENFSLFCFFEGFLSRGAIVKGSHYIDKKNDIMISPAFIEAYNIEKKESVYPRILIKDEVFDFLIKDSKMDNDAFHVGSLVFVKDYIEKDFDNKTVVRPFRNIEIIAKSIYKNYKDRKGRFFRKNIDEEYLCNELLRFKQYFDKYISDNKEIENHIKEKFNYLAKEFNETLEKCSNRIDVSNFMVKILSVSEE